MIFYVAKLQTLSICFINRKHVTMRSLVGWMVYKMTDKRQTWDQKSRTLCQIGFRQERYFWFKLEIDCSLNTVYGKYIFFADSSP